MKLKPILVPAFIVLATASGVVMADSCAVTVNGNDAMQFDTKTVTVAKGCKKFDVTLHHTGKLAKTVMGHNWVLTKTEDSQAVATDGVAAGVDHNYIKAGDTRVIASTKIIGGGESTTVSVPVDKLTKGTSYTFFCSFPGHISLMKGTLTLE